MGENVSAIKRAELRKIACLRYETRTIGYNLSLCVYTVFALYLLLSSEVARFELNYTHMEYEP